MVKWDSTIKPKGWRRVLAPAVVVLMIGGWLLISFAMERGTPPAPRDNSPVVETPEMRY